MDDPSGQIEAEPDLIIIIIGLRIFVTIYYRYYHCYHLMDLLFFDEDAFANDLAS